MLTNRFAALFYALFTLPFGLCGQVVTVTEHASTCSAIYTSGSISLTLIQSTVSVQPSPWSDAAANSGTPFVLEVQQTSGLQKRQTRQFSWLTYIGNTTTDPDLAQKYQIKNGMLLTLNGSYVSTGADVLNQAFAASAYVEPINTTFFVTDGRLNWTNPNFSNGTAQFYKLPANLLENASVLVKFLGPMEPARGWSTVILWVRPLSSLTGSGGTILPLSPSMTILSTILYSPSAFPYPASPSGECGDRLGYTCTQSGFGDCCSAYGYCGSGNDYCGSGCQSAFGSCNAVQPPASVSSMSMSIPVAMGTSISQPAGISMSLPVTSSGALTSSGNAPYSTPSGGPISFTPPSSPAAMSRASPTMSSASATPTWQCPGVNGQTVTDVQDIQYTVGCGEDTPVGAYGSAKAPHSYNDCFAFCDAESHCTAFSYSGGNEGIGSGICYFKNQPVTFTSGSVNIVGAIRISPFATSSNTTSSPIPSSVVSSNAPIPPGIPPASNSKAASSAPASLPMSMSMGMLTSSTLAVPMPMSTSASVSISDAVTMTTTSPSSTGTSGNSVGRPVSPNGHCGNANNGGTVEGYTCAGSVFGQCCSSSGFCGNTTDYCGPTSGCQSMYGTCPATMGTTISQMGECGSGYNQTCVGSQFGNCCSVYGYCGSAVANCAPGNCDPNWGYCWMASSSSVSTTTSGATMPAVVSSLFVSPSSPAGVSPTSSSGSSSSSLRTRTYSGPYTWTPTVTTASSSSSSSSTSMPSMASTPSAALSSAAPTFSCPNVSGQIVTDSNGLTYMIMCGSDTTSGSFSTKSAANSWDDCFAICDAATINQGAGYCTAFTYLGGSNGIGSGTCFLKSSASESFTGSGSGLVGAIRVKNYVGALGQSSSASAVVTTTKSASSPSLSAQLLARTTTTTTSSSAISQVSSSVQPVTTTTTTTTSSSSSSSSSAVAPTITSVNSSSSAPAPVATTSTSPSLPAAASLTSSTSSTSAYLVLPSPTLCDFGDPVGTDEDDSYCEIDLPFSMQIYSQSSTASFASTNGFLSILVGSSQYEANSLPFAGLPNDTVCPMFDDLEAYESASPMQGIFYQFNTQSTAVTYEYYIARAGNPNEIYHFLLAYDSAKPGVFTYTYYNVGEGNDGANASVGAQGVNSAGAQVAAQYSYKAADITNGLRIICDTTRNTCVTG